MATYSVEASFYTPDFFSKEFIAESQEEAEYLMTDYLKSVYDATHVDIVKVEEIDG